MKFQAFGNFLAIILYKQKDFFGWRFFVIILWKIWDNYPFFLSFCFVFCLRMLFLVSRFCETVRDSFSPLWCVCIRWSDDCDEKFHGESIPNCRLVSKSVGERSLTNGELHFESSWLYTYCTCTMNQPSSSSTYVFSLFEWKCVSFL